MTALRAGFPLLEKGRKHVRRIKKECDRRAAKW
jgi:hypothetical protein